MRNPSRWLAAVAAASFLLLPGSEAFAYRFYARSVNDSMVPEADDAVRWARSAWGPGASLPWVISDAAEWADPWVDFTGEAHDSPFESAADVAPYVRRALEAWSAVPTADIRWRLSGTRKNLHTERDYVNAVRPHALDLAASYAAIFVEDGRIVECDISFAPGHTVNFPDGGLATLIHELGHCIGLAHAAMFPTWDSSFWRDDLGDGLWPQDPKMSYGFDRDHSLTGDDALGASLLRPRSGWRHGAVSGSVTFEGHAARFVRVVGTRIETDGSLGRSAGVFTNERGEFILEGLEPGDYLLAAGPMVRSNAHRSLLDAGATMHGVQDQFLLEPIPVSLGSSTRAPPIALGSGRVGANPPPEAPE